MVTWFRERAPIRRKLTISFGLMTAVTVGALALAWWTAMELDPRTGPAAADYVQTVLWIGSATLVGAAIALGYALNRIISNPYVTTVVRMEGLAAGDLETPIQFTAYADCVGRLTKAMFTFRDNALAKVQADADAVTAARQSEEERRAAEADAIHRQEELVVGSIGAGLERLAAGDLTFVLADALPGAYERLRSNFNQAVTKLHDALTVITANTRTMRSGATEISSAADDLSRRTEQQAASLEETAAALDEITATVRKTAEGAQHAASRVAAKTTPSSPARSCARR